MSDAVSSGARPTATPPAVLFAKAERLLAGRMAELTERIGGGDEAA